LKFDYNNNIKLLEHFAFTQRYELCNIWVVSSLVLCVNIIVRHSLKFLASCTSYFPHVFLNLLKPDAYFMYSTTSFNIQQFCVLPTMRLCVLLGSQNKQRFFFSIQH